MRVHFLIPEMKFDRAINLQRALNLLTIANSSWLKSISYLSFCPKINAIETVTEYETKAIAMQSTNSSFQMMKLGSVGSGNPTGM